MSHDCSGTGLPYTQYGVKGCALGKIGSVTCYRALLIAQKYQLTKKTKNGRCPFKWILFVNREKCKTMPPQNPLRRYDMTATVLWTLNDPTYIIVHHFTYDRMYLLIFMSFYFSVNLATTVSCYFEQFENRSNSITEVIRTRGRRKCLSETSPLFTSKGTRLYL